MMGRTPRIRSRAGEHDASGSVPATNPRYAVVVSFTADTPEHALALRDVIEIFLHGSGDMSATPDTNVVLTSVDLHKDMRVGLKPLAPWARVDPQTKEEGTA